MSTCCSDGCFAMMMPQDGRIASLRACKKELATFIDKNNCGPIMIRMAWHDSGTFDQRITEWPQRGGANGAIIFDPEMDMGANAGLHKAKKFLEPFKDKYKNISWADLIQLASATAVEVMGGPKIDMKYGRVSVTGPEGCAPPASREGFAGNAGLPDAFPPFGCGAVDAASHLRNVFGKKMGFTDEEIVAIGGAHTIGRAFKERSGTCPFGYTDAAAAKYTKEMCLVRKDKQAGIGMAGGASWTQDWLTFNNSYYTEYKEAMRNPELLWFPTDEALHTDPKFKVFFDTFAKSEKAFFTKYAVAHKKLSELGSKFEPAEGLKL